MFKNWITLPHRCDKDHCPLPANNGGRLLRRSRWGGLDLRSQYSLVPRSSANKQTTCLRASNQATKTVSYLRSVCAHIETKLGQNSSIVGLLLLIYSTLYSSSPPPRTAELPHGYLLPHVSSSADDDVVIHCVTDAEFGRPHTHGRYARTGRRL